MRNRAGTSIRHRLARRRFICREGFRKRDFEIRLAIALADVLIRFPSISIVASRIPIVWDRPCLSSRLLQICKNQTRFLCPRSKPGWDSIHYRSLQAWDLRRIRSAASVQGPFDGGGVTTALVGSAGRTGSSNRPMPLRFIEPGSVLQGERGTHLPGAENGFLTPTLRHPGHSVPRSGDHPWRPIEPAESEYGFEPEGTTSP